MEEVRVILSRGSDRSFRAAVFLRLAGKNVAPAGNKTGRVAFIIIKIVYLIPFLSKNGIT